MLYTIENHLDTVPVIASFSRDGQVIPLYVQLDNESIRVSCRSSQKFIDGRETVANLRLSICFVVTGCVREVRNHVHVW